MEMASDRIVKSTKHLPKTAKERSKFYLGEKSKSKVILKTFG
jgi:hypothetical protein